MVLLNCQQMKAYYEKAIMQPQILETVDLGNGRKT